MKVGELDALDCRDTEQGATLRLRVQPGARGNVVIGVHGAALKVALQAPPVEGAANKALAKFLARKVFDIKPRDVQILSGERGRDKVVLLCGLSARELRGRLAELP